MEIWRDVKGFEGKYQVSNEGHVRSICRIERFRNSERLRKGKMIKQRLVGRYISVVIKNYGNNKSAFVHRLVAESFIGNVDGMVVDHIDFNPVNNRLDNLQILTQKENIDRSVLAKRHNHGESHGMAKLTNENVIELRNTNRGEISNVCSRMGISYGHAKKIRSGKLWKQVAL